MTKQDWIKLLVLIVVSGALWTWVWIEYQKPIIDPELLEIVTSEVYAGELEK